MAIYTGAIVLKPGDRVLDSGTGSGEDRPRKCCPLPYSLSFQEPGFFHSLKKFPPQSLLQQSIIQSRTFPESFPQTSFFSSIRSQIYPVNGPDTYSLVNQRFLFTALTGPQWEVALQELHRVIVPGGWVQLVEAKAISGHMGPFSTNISNLCSAFLAHKGLLFDIANRLPDMLTQAGFINVSSETRALPLGQWAGQDGIGFRDDVTSVLSAIRGPLFEAGGLGLVSSEQEYDYLIACVRKEWDDGQEVSARQN